MSKVGLIAGILSIALVALALLAGCEEPSGYRTPNPCVEDIRNCDYPELDSLYLRERRLYEQGHLHEHMRSRRN
jgi:hypothetical protein